MTDTLANHGPDEPFVPASKSLPEITLRGVILSIILTVVLAAANAYLGLKVGVTVSASIPAAVISMGILRFFKNSNLLENNIVQTAASAGEALVAGVAYILPALIVLHYWHNFGYWETVFIALTGGFLGVIFSIPLRRVLLADKELKFPEGTAIGKVLMAEEDKDTSAKPLVFGGLIGGLVALFQSGFKLISETVQLWTVGGSNVVFGFGLGFSPVLVAAGYIIGISAVLAITVGVIIGWLLGVPVVGLFVGIPSAGSPIDMAQAIHSVHIRYIGVGTMILGGFWTLFNIAKPVVHGIRSSLKTARGLSTDFGTGGIPRTEHDISIKYVFWSIAVVAPLLFFMFNHFLHHLDMGFAASSLLILAAFSAIFSLISGFIVAAVCGYFAGLVGSTNNPVSGMSLGILMIGSLLIAPLLHIDIHYLGNSGQILEGEAIAIIITTIAACAASIGADTIQDLKAGQMVGATPWKQQLMLIVGVVISALVIPPILQLLFDAYGIGGVMPRANMDPTQMLAAPQAGMMSALVRGIFDHNLPWSMVIIGLIIAFLCIIADELLKKRNIRLPVLAVGLGIYLPLYASTPLIFGAIASFLVEKRFSKKIPAKKAISSAKEEQGRKQGVLLACGIVAGAALMGVILAIPFAVMQSTEVLSLRELFGLRLESYKAFADLLGLITAVGLAVWLYKITINKKKS